MTTRAEHLPGSHLQAATTGVHICEHPDHVAATAIMDLAEVRYCGACHSSWSELGTRGHRWPRRVPMTTSSDFRAGGVVTNPATSASPPLRLHPDECLLVRRSDRWVCIRVLHCLPSKPLAPDAPC